MAFRVFELARRSLRETPAFASRTERRRSRRTRRTPTGQAKPKSTTQRGKAITRIPRVVPRGTPAPRMTDKTPNSWQRDGTTAPRRAAFVAAPMSEFENPSELCGDGPQRFLLHDSETANGPPLRDGARLFADRPAPNRKAAVRRIDENARQRRSLFAGDGYDHQKLGATLVQTIARDDERRPRARLLTSLRGIEPNEPHFAAVHSAALGSCETRTMMSKSSVARLTRVRIL
jgi:hypothetical protein